MHNSQNKKKLQIVLLVLVAVLTLGIGYASITAINSIININGSVSANQENFKVYFTEATITDGKGTVSIDEEDATIGYFDITGLSNVGDEATATYTVLNDSNGVGANISLDLTNSNNEYFKVIERVEDDKLQAGETTRVTVKVEMIKTPLDSDVSTNISAKLTATPIDNAQATGGSPASKASDDPVSFAIDSWATIQKAVQNNNTSAYNVGDTKVVKINNTDYTVRLANKSVDSKCSNSDYSGTACGFVVEFVDIITTMTMRDTLTNEGGYPETIVYAYLRDTLYGQLPTDLQGVIKQTKVLSGSSNIDGYYTSIDYLYLLSEKELFNSSNYDSAYNTFQLDYYKDKSNSKIKKYQGTDTKWWLRAAVKNDNTTFRLVTTTGSLSLSNLDNSVGVSPAFRIG